jgi:hypothetical protein
MDLAEGAKPLTLDGQYIAVSHIDKVKMNLVELMRQQYLTCRIKSYSYLVGQANEFDHFGLFHFAWGECGELEIISLDDFTTLIRFYSPGRIELEEIEKYQTKIRSALSQPPIEIWFYETMGWIDKIIGIFTEELFGQRLALLRNYENAAASRLGLIPYPLAYFQILPAAQIGMSQIQSVSPQLQSGISLPPWDIPQRLVGISQIKPENSGRPDWISQLPQDDPQPQFGISQNLPDIHPAKSEVDWDIARKHAMCESDIPLNRDDQELLRLWILGRNAKEIAMRIGKADKTVTNRLSVLRGMLGEERVPLRKAPTRKDLG